MSPPARSLAPLFVAAALLVATWPVQIAIAPLALYLRCRDRRTWTGAI